MWPKTAKIFWTQRDPTAARKYVVAIADWRNSDWDPDPTLHSGNSGQVLKDKLSEDTCRRRWSDTSSRSLKTCTRWCNFPRPSSSYNPTPTSTRPINKASTSPSTGNTLTKTPSTWWPKFPDSLLTFSDTPTRTVWSPLGKISIWQATTPTWWDSTVSNSESVSEGLYFII